MFIKQTIQTITGTPFYGSIIFPRAVDSCPIIWYVEGLLEQNLIESMTILNVCKFQVF